MPNNNIVIDRLSRGEPVLDAIFDGVYPPAVRDASSAFWTPVRIALRATRLLTADGASRVLDVGSGVGKLCIIGAATTCAQFIGVERRPGLVDVSRLAAAKYGLRSTWFVHGTFDLFDIRRFDALYLFNPFEENLWPAESHLDDSVELGPHRFWTDLDKALAMLDRAREGTRAVTYHGFGTTMPHAWECDFKDGHLELWIKSRRTCA